MSNLFNLFIVHCDAPKAFSLYSQNCDNLDVEILSELRDNIMFYLVITLFGFAWVLISLIRSYINSKSPTSNWYLHYGTLIELILTIRTSLPFILMLFLSFNYVYLIYEVTDICNIIHQIINFFHTYEEFLYYDMYIDDNLIYYSDGSLDVETSNASGGEGSSHASGSDNDDDDDDDGDDNLHTDLCRGDGHRCSCPEYNSGQSCNCYHEEAHVSALDTEVICSSCGNMISKNESCSHCTQCNCVVHKDCSQSWHYITDAESDDDSDSDK